ncbi:MULTISPECIES: Nudix family hydrolase [Methylomonas]|uniref:8-oxo-dGTP diphosphatase n=2 Tax=Methylomonas TaxID=416 RepID=A0A126T2J6_9GAMM|nr:MULTISPECIES: Nudix family hydrolase [Methylomonas]AMK76318.1 DNA mismatch repair protein MutT [Methylomonas denitrificans]OAI00754.1 DNA mismatch repair protein MutT [Methylomonas methanica]TCV88340.1 8-oxo-dGTPase [Methylomonas methanica]
MSTNKQRLHVAVGVIRDGDGRILITQRAKHAHQGGLWEFPGGKLEADEPVQQALARELAEEVGIQVQTATPLIKINHDYGDRHVLLDVWSVTAFSGQASGCEGQAMRWVNVEQLQEFSFPAANVPIIAAAQIPHYYAILEGRSADDALNNCNKILASGAKLLQFRVKSLPIADLQNVFEQVSQLCRQQQVSLLVNADLPVDTANAQGLHLSSRALLTCNERPNGYRWVAASCHNLDELRYAEALGLDFAVLAPVQATASHPDAAPLGWQTLTELLEHINLPVFALGGLGRQDLDRALAAGAQGIAGISAFLSDD